jgi:tRNA1Val (adenine37-N6)-methyltransferase
MPRAVIDPGTTQAKDVLTDVVTDDALAGDYRVFQRKGGHRYSLDDTLTAWVAARARPEAPSAVDLGCGIGSVLLMTAYALPHARLYGLEAQAISFELAERNIARNGLDGRVCAELGDMRDPATLDRLLAANGGRFELVTGTPPYLPQEHGTLPPDSQKAHARFELRGGVEAYIDAAARVLAPAGRFVVCAGARADDRVLSAAAAHGLHVLEKLPVIPSPLKGVLFSVWTLSTSAAFPLKPPLVEGSPFMARDQAGARTQAALELRSFFGLPNPVDEANSPRVRARGRAPREGSR